MCDRAGHLGQISISIDLESKRGKEALRQEPGGFPEVGGPVREHVKGTHTLTSGQNLPQCLRAFILTQTLMKWGWGGRKLCPVGTVPGTGSVPPREGKALGTMNPVERETD